MHIALKELLDRTVQLFRQDPRCLAAYHFGSIGTADEDAYSDVDPVFIVRPEDFDQVDRELPSIFSGFCPTIHLWWPEAGNCDTWRNYAVLFEADRALLQYDVTIMKPPQEAPVGVLASQFIFDKAGILAVLEKPQEQTYSPDRLLWHMQRFWVYAYIHAKYLRRADSFKLLFAQQELFREHLAALCALSSRPDTGWWPQTANQVVSKENLESMLLYFGSATRESIEDALKMELDAFSQAARVACEKWSIEYPDSLEQVVRQHLARACGDADVTGPPR